MLVTTTEGQQTFGFSHYSAPFPSFPPVITMPPYTEIDFPLYLKPASQKFEDVVAAVVKSLRQPDTPLNTAFFSRQNVDLLQGAIRERMRASLGVVLDRQSDWELLLIMRRVYLESASNWPDDLAAEVDRLNSLVMQISVDAISRNVTSYMTYRNKLEQPVPLPNPADALTMTPYPSGPPVPLPDLNAEYELGMRAFKSTLGPLKIETATPYPFEAQTIPPSDLNAAYQQDLQAFMSTPLPPNTRTPQAVLPTQVTGMPILSTDQATGMPYSPTAPPMEVGTLPPVAIPLASV